VLKDVEIQAGKPLITITTSTPLLAKSDILVQQNSKILLPNYKTVTLRDSKLGKESLIWSIMPNPSNNGRFMLDSSKAIDKISIFDVHGRDVSFTQDGQYLNMDAIPGVYVITISSKGEKSSKKVIITK
jgi:hypothetical protein